MKRLKLFIIFATLPLLAALGGLLMLVAADEVHWGYEGDAGPSQWGALSPDFNLCEEGQAQSPIDIRAAVATDLVDINFHYGKTANSIYNNGHTIQVNTDPGSHIVYNGIRYDLLQFHFHSPSEHTIAGEAAALEIHFVHQDRNSGNLAVVGVLLTDGGSDNAAYAAVFDNLPDEVGEPEPVGEAIALAALLPETLGYYTYQGSLTTPPCSEVVRWLLLDEPVALSAGQVAAFRAIYDGNARPTLPLGQRDLLHTRR